MRKLIVALAAAAAFATPALAETLDEVVAHGIVIQVPGQDIEVTYTPDHKFTALDGQVTGTWRIDGTKLCTTSNFQPDEQCVEYPTGKKSGDSFEVTSPQGTATVKIK